MKIATWNVNEYIGITCNLDNQETVDTIDESNVKEMIDIINANDFDIVCLQEYTTHVDGKEGISERIVRQTNLKHYCAHDTYDSFMFEGGRVGVAVFSRTEITDSTLDYFQNPNMTKTSSTGIVYNSVDKGIIKITTRIDGKEYTVITGHAMAFAPFDKTEFDYPESFKPLEEIILKNIDSNLIVAGDFNTEKLFDLMPSLSGRVVDVVKGPTTKDYYEKSGEIQRDYILINQNIQLVKTFKIDNFSDHYAIGAELH